MSNSIQFILIILAFTLSASAKADIAIDPGTGNCIDTAKNQSLPPNSPQCASLVQNAKQKKIADCFAAGGQCANSSCMQEPEIQKACCNGGQSGGLSLPGCPGGDKEITVAPPEGESPKVKVGGTPTPAAPGGGPAKTSPAAKTPDRGDPSADKDPTNESAKADESPSENNSAPGGSSPNNQAALQACYDAADDAASACGSVGGGGFSAGSGGINSYSSTLYGAAGSAANSNLQRALYCTNRSRNCAAQCSGVDAGTASECEGYSVRTQALGRQAQQALGAQTGAQNAGSASGASPSLAARQMQGCDFNPTAPECRALDEAQKRGDAGFDNKPLDDPGFNVSANGVGTQSNSAYTGNGQGLDAIKNAPPTRTVANNSGGPIPGQGASGSAGFDKSRPGSPGAPGYTTDVLQGFQGGGGSPSPGSPGFGNDRKLDGRWRVPAANGQAPPTQVGFDLKKYLPGGARQNSRHLGGYIPFSTEINPPSVNIWSRISDRLIEKCRLGELFDCR